MKTTGIVRQLDQLGRIVVPKELRTTLGIKRDNPVEIFVDDNSIILRKYEPGCAFCGELDDIVQFEGRRICKKCLANIKKMK